MRVGFIGLGNMGRPMAANLAKAGQDLIVYDLNRKVVDAKSAKDLGEDARRASDATAEFVAHLDG